MTLTKVCRLCNTEKPLDNYYKSTARTRDGTRHECKSCTNIRSSSYYQANKHSQAEKRRNYFFKTTYGLTLEELNKKKQEQNNCCAICKKQAQLVVDHNHDSGGVRALLCSPCNQALGLVYENTETLLSMIAYIEENK